MELSSVSRQRRRIMGFAMMWIVFFHMSIGKSPSFPVWFVHRIGFYGVDLFLLVSGLGLWFSLEKGGSVGAFCKRRAVRILPAYLTVVCIYYAFRRVSAGAFLLSVSTVGYWLQRTHFDWFIPTLILFYAAAPWLYRLYKRLERPLLFVLAALALSAGLCVIAALTGLRDLFGSIVRFPVFCLGFWFGDRISRAAKQDENGVLPQADTKVKTLPCLAALVFGAAAAYVMNRFMKGGIVQAGLNAYPALILAPALAIALGALFELISDKCGRIGSILLFPFDLFGRYSLEIYLLHERIVELWPGLGQGKALLVTLAAAVVLHETIGGVIPLIRKARTPKAA